MLPQSRMGPSAAHAREERSKAHHGMDRGSSSRDGEQDTAALEQLTVSGGSRAAAASPAPIPPGTAIPAAEQSYGASAAG